MSRRTPTEREVLSQRGYVRCPPGPTLDALKATGLALWTEFAGDAWVLEWAKAFWEYGLGATIPLAFTDNEYRLIVTGLLQPAEDPRLRALAVEAAANPEFRKDFEAIWREAMAAVDNLKESK